MRRPAIGSARSCCERDTGAAPMSAKMAPVTSSTSGYCKEMDFPHERQRPRNTIHERTGTRSYHAIWRLHDSHALLPVSDRLPQRRVSTLRKLPIRSPNMPKNDASSIVEVYPAR